MNSVKTQKHSLALSIIVCFSACLFFLYEFVLQVSPNVMTFDMMHDLHVDAAQLGLISGAYYIAYTFMQIPAGMLYDHFGPRSLLSIATLICAGGAFAFGLTDSVFTASLGRFLMGAGSAFAFIGCLVLVSRWFPPQYFALLAGIVQLMSSTGALIGEVPLAAAVEAFGWRDTITVLGYAGIAIALFIFLIVRDSPSSERIPHQQFRKEEFLLLMKRLKNVVKKSQSWFIGMYSFTSWAPIIVFAGLWGVPFLVTVYGVSETTASSAVSMVWIAIGLGSPFMGWWSDRIQSRRTPLMICSLVGLISGVLIVLVPMSFALMYPLLFLFGFAASAQSLSFAVVKDNNKPTMVGTAIGFNNMAVVSGGFLFQPLVGYLLRLGWDGKIVNNVPYYQVADYRLALCIIPACFFVGLILSVTCLRETHCRPTYR